MTQPATILIVDDDKDVLTAARLLLQAHYSRVLTTQNPDEIGSLMSKEHIDVFLLDMNFAIGRNTGDEGLKWLDFIMRADPDAVVILMTAFGDLNTAVRAMQKGATDFVLKPWQNDKLVATLSVATALRRSRMTVNALSVPPPAADMIAVSPAMQKVLNIVERVAPTDVNVLIRGENGTGKELVAQAIHRQSARSSKALVTIDLGAVAENLFESELFGHVKGAFTDANTTRTGRFQAAHEGTLFLDEIGNLPEALQTRLLRALESREVTPVGSDAAIQIDVRLISATNQPLRQMVADGRFREDLLYRINTIEIELPALRDRPEDLQPLAEYFIQQCARKYRKNPARLGQSALATLAAHSWPGNVRELAHAIERAIVLGDADELTAADFSFEPAAADDRAESLNLEANERRMVSLALEQSAGNISHAAEALGITRAALYRRIEKYGL